MKPAPAPQPAAPVPAAGQRREFLKKSLAVALGGSALAVPAGAGLALCLDPLRREPASPDSFVRVTTLDSLPPDGIPRKFPIHAGRRNAWNNSAGARIGEVFLRRTADGALRAFHAACPHAGCGVDYEMDQGRFLCPCHKSTFAVDGTLADPRSQAMRGLDELTIELRGRKEIWVRFQNFQPGLAEKFLVA